MRVDRVLLTKGNDIVSVNGYASLRQAVAVLRKHRIGAVLVLGLNGSIDGILSERDIIGALAERGGDALDETVGEFMTRDVVRCGPNDTIDELMTVMTDRRIRHLPVVDDGQVVGVISIGDVVKHRLAEVTDEANALHDYITLGR